MKGIRTFLYLAAFCLALTPVDAFATNAPGNLAATATSSSEVTLTWTDNASDETGFTFAYDTNSLMTNPTYVYAGGVNTTSFNHTGRSAATTYYYKIKAEGNPDSAWTTVKSATTAPSGLGASATSSSAIDLTWNANGSNANITGYTYAHATNSAFTGASYTWVSGNGSSSASKTGLSTATTYWLKIKAEGTTDALDSPFGSVITETTRPAGLTATVVSGTQINLSWTGNSGNANITGYTISTNTNDTFTGASYTNVSGAGATTLNKTGLYPGTTYYFRVKAEGTSDAYDSLFTASVTATTTSAAPNAPSGLGASVISASRIDLSWVDNSTDETGFELKRATDSGFTQNVVWIGNIQGTSYSNTGLASNTTYYYKVRAEGATQDSAYSSAVNATTNTSPDPLPTAPSGMSATAVSASQINVSWTDNSNNETGFELKRATDSGFTQNVVWVGNIQGTTYSNTGLAPNTTYYFKVRAENAAGQSAYSSAANATTLTSTGTIPPHFFGINAWMPKRIGGRYYNGKLAEKWGDIEASGVKIMRYGGNGVDHYADPTWVNPNDSSETTWTQYLDLVDTMRSKGIEPVLQVPVYGPTYSASQAADLVTFINGTHGRNVKYWSIGNEPDLSGSPYQPTSAATIAAYIKSFATAMKVADPSIRIIGPELTWYNTTLMDPLTACDGSSSDITGTDAYGRYYVDIISYHTYNGFNGTQSRSQVLSALTESGGLNDDLTALKTRLSSCSGRTGANALKIALTEANVNYNNPTGDSLTGVGAKSFVGGQWWAEFMGICLLQGVDFVTFWSTVEGNELGYIGHSDGVKRSAYHHFTIMAKNFRGSMVTTTDNQANAKTFAAKDVDQIVVLLMNQDQSSSFPYTVRLNTASIAGTSSLKVNVNAGVAVESSGTLATESTVLLVFDASGTLKRKLEYKLNGHANAGLGPQETIYP